MHLDYVMDAANQHFLRSAKAMLVFLNLSLVSSDLASKMQTMADQKVTIFQLNLLTLLTAQNMI